MEMDNQRFHRMTDGMEVFRRYLFCWCGIFLGALFCCAGVQMIEQDAGIVQMEKFRPDDPSFLAFTVNEELNLKLKKIEETSGISCEKMLAAVMLKNQFHPGNRIREAEVLSDVLGYERLDENVFLKIASYYRRMCECVEFLPVGNVYADTDSSEDNMYLQYDAGAHVKQAEFQTEDEQYLLRIPVEEIWQELVPVICVKTGTVISSDKSAEKLCLELEDGIRVIYGNLKQDLKEWDTEDRIESGEIMGSVCGDGLILQFLLRTEDGSWSAYNGYSSILYGEKMIRSVTQRVTVK